MDKIISTTMNRRELLSRSAPACAAAYLGLCGFSRAGALSCGQDPQEQHKYDIPMDLKISLKQRVGLEYSMMFDFIDTMKDVLEEQELMRLLKQHSEKIGVRAGESQRQNSPDDSFQTYVATFRPPRYARSLTHEIVEDTEKAFGLKVTECIWATVFRDAGFGGELGHAALCNMDYYWPKAFNPNFAMERDKTLMQGHDQCNHRYIDTT
jgi:hypothetical protein